MFLWCRYAGRARACVCERARVLLSAGTARSFLSSVFIFSAFYFLAFLSMHVASALFFPWASTPRASTFSPYSVCFSKNQIILLFMFSLAFYSSILAWSHVFIKIKSTILSTPASPAFAPFLPFSMCWMREHVIVVCKHGCKMYCQRHRRSSFPSADCGVSFQRMPTKCRISMVVLTTKSNRNWIY